MRTTSTLFTSLLGRTRGILVLEDGRLRFEAEAGPIVFALGPADVSELRWPSLLRGRPGVGQLQVVTSEGATHRLSFIPNTMIGSMMTSLRVADAWKKALEGAGFSD